MPHSEIEVKGARVNNLKNISLKIPRGVFAVVTGVSGSGKSSLAFDTLYAEGKRRYVESLSAYARQFLGRIPKPECDYIKGLPPAIAIEQKVGSRNPRSTVGTATEIYDYLRMLYARIGRTYSPITGDEVKKYSIDNIVDSVMLFEPGTRIAVLAPIEIAHGRSINEQLDVYTKVGFSRLEKDGEFIDISEVIAEELSSIKGYNLLIDRMRIGDDNDLKSQLTESIETAYYEGHDECIIKTWSGDGEVREHSYSKRFACDGMVFREPSDLMFNFNNPYGACDTCEGYGNILGISEDLVVPDKSLSIYQGAVQCWRGEKMSECQQELIRLSTDIKFPIHTPYNELSKEEKNILWHGKGAWEGIDGFFKWVDSNQYKIQYRVLKARYRGRTICPTCHGSRLKPDTEYVKINNKSITELLQMPIKELRIFFENIKLTPQEALIASRLLKELNNRLMFLDDVGLGYLTLSRGWATLSGGESQRIKLATSLGSALVGSLYVLDEPSIGLHPRDTKRLISVLKRLRDIGNTLVVVDHDEEIMRSSDYLIDIGPGAGSLGGNLIFAGDIKEALRKENAQRHPESRTLSFLSGVSQIETPRLRRPWKKRIRIEGACENNLKNISVEIPLGVMTVVTGVSGSGKSTLVHDILYKGLKMRLGEPDGKPGSFKALSGDISTIGNVEYIDQDPIGTSTRSNAATYLKIYDEIRRLYSEQPLAKQMNFSPSYFSFNTEGGRCEDCKGEGVVTIPMQFMADIIVPCESCHGKRFKQDVLDVLYQGKTIYDILEMTVEDAITFFNEDKENTQAHKIARKLQPLMDVGLSYLPLGQPSSTLSGGENQRLKLAYFLSAPNNVHTLFILDEPTTGLHTADISTLLSSLNKIIANGNSVLIIEHNMHVAKSADWIIDLGPDGGAAGGEVVSVGTPESVAADPESITGKYLSRELQSPPP
jgi:excinuclease ABC subunit A